ncbi:MAG: hypothetical protein PWR29_529 [Methanolobus sp.]|nr:hypothetical protein [Methanolobus sp.]
MNRKQIITVGVLIAGVLLFSNLALATTAENIGEEAFASLTGPDDLYSEMEEQILLYNSRLDDVPWIVKRIAGNDVILFDITTNEGEKLYAHVITNNGEVLYYEKVSSPAEVDPSVTVTTDEETARKIVDSDSPYNEFKDALGREEISVETESTLKRIALGTFMTVNKVL